MKTHTLLVVLAALSLSGGLATAQTGQPGQTPETGQPGSSSTAADQSRGSRDETVTVTGCLKQGGSGAETGSAGSTSSSGSSSATAKSSHADSGYMLTHARLGSGTNPSSSSTPPGSSSTASSTAPSGGQSGSNRTSAGMTGGVYSVTGLSDSELKPHVNHQVEITGRIESGQGSIGGTGSASSTGSTSSSAASSSTTGSSMNIDHAPRLHGTSIKMISSTCRSGTE